MYNHFLSTNRTWLFVFLGYPLNSGNIPNRRINKLLIVCVFWMKIEYMTIVNWFDKWNVIEWNCSSGLNYICSIYDNRSSFPPFMWIQPNEFFLHNELWIALHSQNPKCTAILCMKREISSSLMMMAAHGEWNETNLTLTQTKS